MSKQRGSRGGRRAQRRVALERHAAAEQPQDDGTLESWTVDTIRDGLSAQRNVLMLGTLGSGKSLTAQLLAVAEARAGGRLVIDVDCKPDHRLRWIPEIVGHDEHVAPDDLDRPFVAGADEQLVNVTIAHAFLSRGYAEVDRAALNAVQRAWELACAVAPRPTVVIFDDLAQVDPDNRESRRAALRLIGDDQPASVSTVFSYFDPSQLSEEDAERFDAIVAFGVFGEQNALRTLRLMGVKPDVGLVTRMQDYRMGECLVCTSDDSPREVQVRADLDLLSALTTIWSSDAPSCDRRR